MSGRLTVAIMYFVNETSVASKAMLKVVWLCAAFLPTRVEAPALLAWRRVGTHGLGSTLRKGNIAPSLCATTRDAWSCNVSWLAGASTRRNN